MRVLVSEQRLDLQTVSERDIDDGADCGRAVGIDRLTGDQLEEITPEAIPAKWRDLDALGTEARGVAADGDEQNRPCQRGSACGHKAAIMRRLALAAPKIPAHPAPPGHARRLAGS